MDPKARYETKEKIVFFHFKVPAIRSDINMQILVAKCTDWEDKAYITGMRYPFILHLMKQGRPEHAGTTQEKIDRTAPSTYLNQPK